MHWCVGSTPASRRPKGAYACGRVCAVFFTARCVRRGISSAMQGRVPGWRSDWTRLHALARLVVTAIIHSTTGPRCRHDHPMVGRSKLCRYNFCERDIDGTQPGITCQWAHACGARTHAHNRHPVCKLAISGQATAPCYRHCAFVRSQRHLYFRRVVDSCNAAPLFRASNNHLSVGSRSTMHDGVARR